MDECDTNENGGISKKEAKDCIAAHVPEEHQEEAEAMVDEMWPMVDKDGSGEVDEHELSEAMRGPPEGGNGPNGPPPALTQLLKKGKGKKAAKKLAQKGPSAKDIMDACDTDESGGISKEEAHACIDEHMSGSDAEEAHDAVDEGFAEADKDGSGELEIKELRAAMQSLGFEAKNQTIFQMISDLDKNKSGSIDFEEFLDMMTARMSDKDTREDISKVFRLFDDDTSGSITLRNLRRVAKELGETMTDEELQEMIDRADSNGDGAVSMDDFYNIMTKKTFA